jgi:hypothetical protein
MKGAFLMVLAAVAIASLFAFEFRYERFMDGGVIVEVDRFTRRPCYIPLRVEYEKGAERVLSIPKCGN